MISDVELNFSIESGYCWVEEVRVSRDKIFELRKCLWKKARDSLEDSGLDVVQLRKLIELEYVVRGSALSEFLKVCLDFGAVVGFITIGRNGDEAISDQET